VPSVVGALGGASVAILVLVLPLPSRAQRANGAHWSIEGFAGSAVSAKTPLTIRQTGFPELRLTAHYATRPWTGSPYYAARIGRWTGGHAWEVELVHHKLYLTNPPPEIQHFEVSHGYNLVTVNRAARYGGVIARVGAGVVIAHPETTIRERVQTSSAGGLGGGYYLAGPTVQLAVEKRFSLWRELFVAVEGKATGSYARFRIAGGHATAPNVALHGVVGVGWGR
jgi:hypothetical protein